jgi:hypothetical protein
MAASQLNSSCAHGLSGLRVRCDDPELVVAAQATAARLYHLTLRPLGSACSNVELCVERGARRGALRAIDGDVVNCHLTMRVGPCGARIVVDTFHRDEGTAITQAFARAQRELHRRLSSPHRHPRR